MLYEIDFLPVGDGERSGDAICLRYSSDEGSTWTVGVVDGGSKDSGNALCDHIREFYETETIDFMVCTHPHEDHASGLSVVIEEMTVKKILMHCPWDYVDHLFDSVNDDRVTKQSLIQKLKEGHPHAYKLYELAIENNVPVHNAFSDFSEVSIHPVYVVGPSWSYYRQQVINFSSITDVTDDTISQSSLSESLARAGREIIRFIAETWSEEKLVDPEDDATSSENNSSVILLFDFDGTKILLTADAGVPALEEAANRIETLNFSLQDFTFVQAPHHGSKRNVGPSILDRIIGTPKPEGSPSSFTTFISASKEGAPKHPNKRVSNAFTRRGAKVAATQGQSIRHRSPGMPDRTGWSVLEPLPFYQQVEDDD